MAVHRATGAGVLEVKSFLRDASPLLCERVIAAARQVLSESDESVSKTLIDPLNTDDQIGCIIQRLEEEESSRVRIENDGEWPLGSCHNIWRRMKNRLSTEHAIEWFSPADLNPFVAFD